MMEKPVNNIPCEPLRVTHLKPSFQSQESVIAERQDVWHKFIIFNKELDRKLDLLKAVITSCESEVLLPVMCEINNQNNVTFLTKCSANAIENLVKQNLCVTLPGGQDVYMDVILGFLSTQEFQLNPNKVIAQALYYRYEPVKKVLNLDDFENEKMLCSIFCPISIPKILHFVLRCTKMGILGNNRESRLPVRELSLRHNKITAIILFEKFFNYHLTKLDLRNNDILDIEYLRYFSEYKISELWLDGNPLCTKYTSSEDYIQAVKAVFPHLQKLDGVVIGMEKKYIPTVQSNFLGDGNELSLIKQFIKHYFTLYDQDDRTVMNGLYDRDALYSMTLGAMSNSSQNQTFKMFATNRNLLKFVDYAKCHEFLLQGSEKIISALRRQPATTHNFKTFYVDQLHQGPNHIAISVQGLFSYREISCPPMLFNRTFVISKKEDNEYCIINDQYYIDGTPHNNAAGSNEVKPVPKFTPTIFSVSEKDQLLLFLHELTTMNRKYCNQYLENAGWDIRSAIVTFIRKYTVNDVPPEAFIPCG